MVSNQLMYMIMKEKVGLSRSFNGKQEIEMMGIREGSFGLVQDVGEALTLHIEVDTALSPRARIQSGNLLERQHLDARLGGDAEQLERGDLHLVTGKKTERAYHA